VPDGVEDVMGWMHAQIEGSLHRLNVAQLHGVLLHRPAQLLEPRGDALATALHGLKSARLVRNIGVSIYQPDELDAVMPRLACNIVQAPFNLFDRRMAASGWMQRLQTLGCELHLRSAFLQGLLLMGADERPTQFRRWAPLWTRWHAWLLEHRIEPLQACLRFALRIADSAKIVLGVDSARQLAQILDAADGPLPGVPDDLCSDDPELLNPSLWTR
jgi:aryl-alcohol dehydrogenase-like predicted oxidoreductase